MAIDDKLEKLVEGLRVEENASLQLVIQNALMASFPYMGAAIGSLLIDKWKKRLIERVVTLFTEIKNRLEKLDETALDNSYFETEEFQTILFLALQQLQTTHNKRKIRMLAWAVANSGTRDYSADNRKEIFVRAVRELTPDHIEMLKRFRPAIQHEGRTLYGRETLKRLGDFDLLVANDLVRLGFVRESLEYPILRHRHTGTRPEELAAKTEELASAILDRAPARSFDITNLGSDFMKFIGEAPTETPI